MNYRLVPKSDALCSTR